LGLSDTYASLVCGLAVLKIDLFPAEFPCRSGHGWTCRPGAADEQDCGGGDADAAGAQRGGPSLAILTTDGCDCIPETRSPGSGRERNRVPTRTRRSGEAFGGIGRGRGWLPEVRPVGGTTPGPAAAGRRRYRGLGHRGGAQVGGLGYQHREQRRSGGGCVAGRRLPANCDLSVRGHWATPTWHLATVFRDAIAIRRCHDDHLEPG
jgi:hypothetical protein